MDEESEIAANADLTRAKNVSPCRIDGLSKRRQSDLSSTRITLEL